jgi:hypothetical protein
MSAYDDIDMEGALDGEVTPEEGLPESTDPQQQPEVPAEAPWDGNSFPLKYRGEVRIPKSKDELINLAQKGISYTTAMERFNKDKKSFDEQLYSLKKQYEPYDQFNQTLQQNPALAQRIQEVAQEYLSQQPNQSQAPAAQNPMYGQLMQEIENLKKQNLSIQEAEDDKKVNEMVHQLKANYPHHDWETDDGTGTLAHHVIQFAYDNGIYNLDHAYKAMMWDQNGTNAKAEALKKATQAKQQATKAGIVRQGQPSGGMPGKPGYSYGDSYNDLARRMVNEMK